ncbi:hypothetical protein AYK61_26570 [Rhodococcus sp. SBT000017]|jgi:hypothetical protein|uniref:hypothetical protein n=1 Tax=Rhodococcus sp. SBT000017 TaxID=1803385 RepID=UPI000EF900A2|nr:hypothetical protein [Rhodococcus sp. SBT000017]RMB70173.1 hypothetical protein AYK61_25905 [Rhodococcus sp. SBT000017]RMB70285.1 hypothetical protein AYK61_26570 [Rhodococcus sp. SBT000017]
MAIEWTDSADKHGIDHADALHAIENAYYVEREFDEPRVPGLAKPWLFIGPPRTLGGALLEVMVEVIPPRGMVVFHVMEARPKHLDRMTD